MPKYSKSTIEDEREYIKIMKNNVMKIITNNNNNYDNYKNNNKNRRDEIIDTHFVLQVKKYYEKIVNLDGRF